MPESITINAETLHRALSDDPRCANPAEIFERIRALGEILEDQPPEVRPISPELAYSLWIMYQTARKSVDWTDEEAFVDVLTNGLKYSARGIPEGTKEPSAALSGHEVREPSPGPKEALSVALRSYLTLYPSLDMGPGSCLAEVLGPTHSDAMEELDHLAGHLAEAVAPGAEPVPAADQRSTSAAAAICGALIAWIEDAPTDGEPTDLVHMDAQDIARLANKIAAALPSPALSPADVRALRWAVQRAAEAALPIGEGELRQRALSAAGRLAATPAVPVPDPRQAELARQAARFLTELQGGETPAAKALEGIGVPLVPTLYEGVMKFIAEWAEDLNRRSGWPGSPESDDPPEPAEDKGGEDGFLRTLAGAATDRIEELSRELTELRAVVTGFIERELALHTNHSDRMAHFENVLDAAVERAVERAVEPAKNAAANAHRVAVKAIDAAKDASREAGDAMAHAKRVWQGHVGDWNKLHERVLELEMHRRGLGDGAAELAAGV